MNYSGKIAYGITPGMSPQRDGGDRVLHSMTGYARGGTEPDFNSNVQGYFKRLDRKRKKVWK